MKLISRDGRLWITFYHQSVRYRRSLDLDDTKTNRKKAEQYIIPEIVYKLNQGVFFEKTEQQTKAITLHQFMPTSFEIHKHERRELTQKKYDQCYHQHIKPQFGNKPIAQIKPSDLAKWQNKLLETRSGKTVKAIRTVFQTILEDAMMDEIITINPFTRVKSPKNDETREKKPFSKEEIFAIINAVPESMQCFFAIGFFTGMRTGEIIGLKWEDVDWDEGIIHVRRSRRQGIETLPKTKNSIREVEIIDVLIPYLQKHRELSSNRGVYIFETYTGKPFTTCDKISLWYWKPALVKAGIQYRNLYQMRHSFASLMIANGEDILWVSNMLGHKDSSMTLQKYARYIKQTRRKRASFLSE
ncbi:tyrosine-type recombinase/integrase [Sulfuricurvum sp.]|uniref:tyrosine-type recombinase/integrase n=1 Tax=Sulfuricurvum sp. TaxID=2025608 RepID=UPI003C39FF17